MRLRHQLIIAEKYVKPERARGIWIPPAWRQDNSRSLWSVVTSSPEADACVKMTLEPGWILVTPPRSGIFLDYDIREAPRFDGVVAAFATERYLLHAGTILRVIPWTTEGASMKVLGNRILVRPDSPETKTPGGLLMPETATKRPVTGVVTEIGADVEDVVVGDRILYSLYAGTDLEIDGERQVILEETQAMAIVEADEKVEAV